jgi:hypothetical protein
MSTTAPGILCCSIASRMVSSSACAPTNVCAAAAEAARSTLQMYFMTPMITCGGVPPSGGRRIAWGVPGGSMPERRTIERARRDARAGKAPSTQAGEFVYEEIEHVRRGQHGARSTKQAIAIGLSKARRAGVKLPPPKKGAASERTRVQAARNLAKGRKSPGKAVSPKRSRAISTALKREGRQAVSRTALSRQATASARKRTAAARSRAAKQAVRTTGVVGVKRAAQKAARTRAAAG